MALYSYIKSKPKGFKVPKAAPLAIKSPLLLKIIPYFSMVLGLFLLLTVLLPIASHEMLVIVRENSRIISPLSQDSLAEARGFINPGGQNVLSAKDEKEPSQFTGEVDYNMIRNWFPTAPLPKTAQSKITSYTLSIPKLGIKDAIVVIGGEKIKERILHYPGTALPGEYGNTVLFCHSVLPIFFNPKNYSTICSTLPTLEKGDKIYIYFDGIQYVYQVEDYFEVKPEDVQVLEQRFNEQILSMITCVPPGTYSRRGVIRARLITI